MSVLISCEVGGTGHPEQWPAQWPAHGEGKRDGPANRRDSGPSSTRSSGVSRRPSYKDSAILRDTTALYVAERMADCLGAPLISNEYAHQWIDVRRSLRHRQLFSKTTLGLSIQDRQRLIETIYLPYRNRLRTKLQRMLSRSPYVIHLSVQSFPLKSSRGRGKKMCRADMGLLYDPGEENEVDLALDWIDEMYEVLPMLRVRRNYPQRGTRDSITKAMRTELAGQNYLGIELLVNQAWAGRAIAIRDEVIEGICGTLKTVLEIPQSKAAA